MMTSIRENKLLGKVISFAFWMLVWYLCALKVGKELILPSPFAVIDSLGRLIVTARFWQATAITIARILSGYALGIMTAVALAVLTCSNSLADAILSPVIRIVRATPVASFIILALLWMNRTAVPVLMSMLMVVPVVWENIVAQYQTTDSSLLEMARAYELSAWKKFRYIYVTSAFPGFLAGCMSAMGLAWKSGIAAEVLSQPTSAIGTDLYYAKIYLESPDLFAWTSVVIILSMCIEKIIRKLLFRGKTNESK